MSGRGPSTWSGGPPAITCDDLATSPFLSPGQSSSFYTFYVARYCGRCKTKRTLGSVSLPQPTINRAGDTHLHKSESKCIGSRFYFFSSSFFGGTGSERHLFWLYCFLHLLESPFVFPAGILTDSIKLSRLLGFFLCFVFVFHWRRGWGERFYIYVYIWILTLLGEWGNTTGLWAIPKTCLFENENKSSHKIATVLFYLGPANGKKQDLQPLFARVRTFDHAFMADSDLYLSSRFGGLPFL